MWETTVERSSLRWSIEELLYIHKIDNNKLFQPMKEINSYKKKKGTDFNKGTCNHFHMQLCVWWDQGETFISHQEKK